MKTGRTLVELAQEIERQKSTKRDFLASASAIRMRASGDEPLALTLNDSARFGITQTGHETIREYTDIPAKYYERMRQTAPQLLAANVNRWMSGSTDTRLVRTLDGNTRSLLSNAYRPLDHADLAEAALPVLLGDLDLELVSCEITERRLYIKCADKRIVREIAPGRREISGQGIEYGIVSPAVVVSNSEVAHGALSIESAMYLHKCTNMHIFAADAWKKHHVGGRAQLDDKFFAMLSDATRKVTDAAIWLQVGDVIRGAFNELAFAKRLEPITATTQHQITADPVKVVEVAAKRFDLTDGEKSSVLTHLIKGGDLTQYGLFNAITRTAQDAASYDRATDLERVGDKVALLPQTDFKRLAEAVALAA